MISSIILGIKSRDLILSLSTNDNNIKLWNILDWTCLTNIQNVNTSGILYSSCFLHLSNNENYILSSNFNSNGVAEPIKVFDFNGNKIREINCSQEHTYFIGTYHSKKLSKYFILVGNFGFISSYDYKINRLYNMYKDGNDKSHYSIVIKENEKENITYIIESCFDGFVRIWNFDSAQLLNKIKINEGKKLYSTILWNNDILFVGTEEKTIEIIDINKGTVINSLIGHTKNVLTLKKINHPQYGECLISQSFDNVIKIWYFKK